MVTFSKYSGVTSAPTTPADPGMSATVPAPAGAPTTAPQAPKTYTPDDFANMIKQKYPQYQNEDNQTLTNAILQKYPQYQSMIQTPVKPQSKAVNFVQGVGKALTSSENAAGNDIAGAIIPHLSITKQAQAASDAADANIQKLVQDLKTKEANGEDTTHITAALKALGANQDSFNVSQVDPTLAKSNLQVAGDFAGVLADTLSAGSYGEAAKGAESGKLLTSSDKIAGIAGKLGLGTTKQAAGSVVKKAGTALAKEIGVHSLEGAAQGYGYDVSNNLQSGKKGLSALKPGPATAVGAILPGASKGAGEVLKNFTGLLSGATKDVVDRAVANPEAVQEAITKFAKNPEQKSELVSKINTGIDTYLKDRSAEYGASLQTLKPTAELTAQSAKDAFVNSVKDFGGTLDDKGNLTFSDSKLTEEDQAALKHTWDVVNTWKDTSVKGLDDLRQRLNNEMGKFNINTGRAAEDKPVADAMKALRSDVSEKVPGYSTMLKDYGDKSSVAQQIKKELQTAGNAKDSTKLSNVMKIFKKDPKIVENITKVLGEKGANDLLNEISGAILSEWTSKAGITTKLGEGAGILEAVKGLHPAGVAGSIATIAGSSPRIVGTAATTIGKAIEQGAGTVARRLGTKVASSLSNRGN